MAEQIEALSSQQPTRLRSNGGLPMLPHPSKPVFYFLPFIATLDPELDFNNTPYYANPMDYMMMCDPIPVKDLRDQLIESLDYRTTTFILQSVMEVGDNLCRPSYFPLLSDLEGYQRKGTGAFAKWLCENDRGEDETFIPSDLVPMFDRKPFFRAECMQVFTLPLKERHLFFSHKSAAVHVMEVHEPVKTVRVNVFACITKKSKIRYHRVSIYGDQTGDGPHTPTFPIESSIIVLNARSVHRPSFLETITKLFNAFTPDVFIVTEARVDNTKVGRLIRDLNGVYDIDTFGTYNRYSGVLLIWAKQGVYPKIGQRGMHGYGHQMGVAIEAGPKNWATQDPTPSSPTYSDIGLDEESSSHDWNEDLSAGA